MGERSALARYVAEFLGTFVLVFTIGCNVLTGQAVWGGVSIACSLTVMIYALGKSSGANFNPAVSLALYMTKNIETMEEFLIYVAVQTAGGICAGFAYLALFKTSFNLGPTEGHSMWQAGLVEIFYTFMLCFVVLNTACSKPHAGKNQFYGLAIGFVIVAGAYSGGNISMGCFNPAVAWGLDVASAHIGFGACIVYTVFELIGGAIAAFLFCVVRPDEKAGSPYGEVTFDRTGNREYPLLSKLISEFIGTYTLVLTVGLNVLYSSPAGAFSIAASLMCMIFALGSVSGAHFNPAVTVAILGSTRGKILQSEAAGYIASQLAGGVAAAFSYTLITGGKTFELKPESSSWGQVFIAEFVFTFVLAFVVLSVATTKGGLSEYFGFAIGMCVTVGGCAIGKISGGSLNPAVSVGISTSHIINGGVFYPCLIYTVIECLAGGAAALAFKATQPSEFKH